MNQANIAQYRLYNQQITTTKFTTPPDLVRWLGAVQAQDYAMAKWAIALRLPNGTDESLENALNQGTIIRTHILRPTWHFVAASDIHWMLALTAPHVKKATAAMHRKLELDDSVFLKSQHIIIKSLEGGQQLTRQELMAAINQAGIRTDALRAAHIMFQAELDGIVCNGAKREKQFTYALLNEKIPPSTKTFTRNEALAELANRYFTSHGPATIPDFAWWSGLTLADARLGVELIKPDFRAETIEGQTYWLSNTSIMPVQKSEHLHLLPAFDEFMVSYKNRTASLLPAHTKETITGNGIFKPIIVVNGKVVGLWKPRQQKDKIRLEVSLFAPTEKLNTAQLTKAAKKYAAFLNTPVEII